jgi:hypothetical protein
MPSVGAGCCISASALRGCAIQRRGGESKTLIKFPERKYVEKYLFILYINADQLSFWNLSQRIYNCFDYNYTIT